MVPLYKQKKSIIIYSFTLTLFLFVSCVAQPFFLFQHDAVSVFDVAFHASSCRVGYEVLVRKQSLAGRPQLSFGASLVILISHFKGLLLKNNVHCSAGAAHKKRKNKYILKKLSSRDTKLLNSRCVTRICL